MAAKSETLTLTGKGFWAQVFEDIRDMTGAIDENGNPWQPDIRDVNEGQYKIAMDLDEDSMKKLCATESQAPKNTRKGPEDENLVTFKRKHKMYSRAGDFLDWASGAPKVTKSDGSKWDFEDDGPIYNGAKVELTVNVYGKGRFCGTRLESVKVIEQGEAPKEEDNTSTESDKVAV